MYRIETLDGFVMQTAATMEEAQAFADAEVGVPYRIICDDDLPEQKA